MLACCQGKAQLLFTFFRKSEAAVSTYISPSSRTDLAAWNFYKWWTRRESNFCDTALGFRLFESGTKIIHCSGTYGQSDHFWVFPRTKLSKCGSLNCMQQHHLGTELEVQILRFYSSPTHQESEGVHLTCLSKSSRGVWCSVKFGIHCSRKLWFGCWGCWVLALAEKFIFCYWTLKNIFSSFQNARVSCFHTFLRVQRKKFPSDSFKFNWPAQTNIILVARAILEDCNIVIL